MPVEKQDVTFIIVDDSSTFRKIHVSGLTGQGFTRFNEFRSLAELQKHLATTPINPRVSYGAITDGLGGDAIGVIEEVIKFTPKEHVWIVSGSDQIVLRAKSLFQGIHSSTKRGLRPSHPLYQEIVSVLTGENK